MLAPPVGGEKVSWSPYLPLASLVSGGVLGGTLLGATIAAVATALSVIPRARLGIALGLLVVAAVSTLWGHDAWWIPQRACQVTGRRLVAQGRVRAGFFWGLDLGIGVRTFLVTPAFYAVIGLGLGARHPALGILIGTVYGLARTCTIAVFSIVVSRRLQTVSDSREPALGLATRSRPILALAALLLAVFVLR